MRDTLSGVAKKKRSPEDELLRERLQERIQVLLGGESFAEAAGKARISESTVRKWFDDAGPNPTISHLKPFVDSHGSSLAEFFAPWFRPEHPDPYIKYVSRLLADLMKDEEAKHWVKPLIELLESHRSLKRRQARNPKTPRPE